MKYNLEKPLYTLKNQRLKSQKDQRDTISLEMVQQSENVKRLIKIRYNEEIVWSEENVSNPD